MGNQLSLFQDRDLSRHALIAALENLNLKRARELADEFRRQWPDVRLVWELDALESAERTKTELGLDGAFLRWQKFGRTPNFNKIPKCTLTAIKRRFFSMVLGANQRLPGLQDSRTRAGRSLGDFHLFADQPNKARKSFERERADYGDSWRLRVQIGNCYSRVKNSSGACSNYRWAFFLGMPFESRGDIENEEFRNWLAEAEDEWVFAEVLLRNEMPPMRFGSRAEFEDFCGQFPADDTKPAEWQFARWYAISENHANCTDSLWLTARKQIKTLKPSLHQRYLSTLR